jgi:hypothetical protein
VGFRLPDVRAEGGGVSTVTNSDYIRRLEAQVQNLIGQRRNLEAQLREAQAAAKEARTLWVVDYLGDGGWEGQSWLIGVFSSEDAAIDAVRECGKMSRFCTDAQGFLIDEVQVDAVIVPFMQEDGS